MYYSFEKTLKYKKKIRKSFLNFFKAPMETDFIFGKNQRIRVTLRNNESEGVVVFDISELIKNSVICPLNSPDGEHLRGNDGKLSTLHLSTQNVIIEEEIIVMDLSISVFKPLKKNHKGSLRLYRRDETKWVFLHKSEEFFGSYLNCSIQISLKTLCENDVRCELFIAVVCEEKPIVFLLNILNKSSKYVMAKILKIFTKIQKIVHF